MTDSNTVAQRLTLSSALPCLFNHISRHYSSIHEQLSINCGKSVSSFFANPFLKWHFQRLFFGRVQSKMCYRCSKCTRCVRTFHSPNRLETLFSSSSRERSSCWIEYQSARPWHNALKYKSLDFIVEHICFCFTFFLHLASSGYPVVIFLCIIWDRYLFFYI